MRRCAVVFLTALIIACTIQPYALAETKVYTLVDCLEIILPEDFWGITEETPQDAPVLKILGVSKDDLIGVYEQTMVCLLAWSREFDECLGLMKCKAIWSNFSVRMIPYAMRSY